jgi:TctA family transporter
MTSALIKIILGVALIGFVIAVGPIVGIWSLNTLFPVLNIPYTLETWAAFFLLFGSVSGLRFGSKKS